MGEVSNPTLESGRKEVSPGPQAMRPKNRVCKEPEGKVAGESEPEGQMDLDGVRDRGRAWSAMEGWEVNLTLEILQKQKAH